jgi:branched-chain amino acid transport system substrate-binding protein
MTKNAPFRIAASALLLTLAAQATAAEVVVGAIAELTGAAADFGKSTARGLQVGAEWLNARKDLGGNTIKLLVEDDATDKGQALTLLNKFALRDQVAVVVGTSSSVLSASIAPRAEELKVPMITIAYSTAAVEGRPWVFKASDTIPRQFQAIANYTADVIKPKACVRVWARDNEAYVQNSKIWGDTVAAKGVKLLDDVTVLHSDTDFSAAATKIVSLKPDCMYLAMSPEGSANFLLQLKSAGLPAATKVIGGTTMGTRVFLDAAGAAAEGTYTLAEYSPGGVNELGKKFEAAYEAKFKEKPDTFAAAGFSEMLIIGEAVKRAGANPSRQAIRDAMAGIKDMETVIGRGKLSMVNRIAQYEMTVLTVKAGKLVVAPGQ